MLADVAAGAISARAADDIYAVKLAEDGSVDHEATGKKRQRKLLERLRECGAERGELAPRVEPPDGAEAIADAYLVDRDEGVFRCHRCATSLGSLGGNPKLEMARRERPTSSLNPAYPDPSDFVDDEVVFREFCCPGCGVRLATETAYPGDAPYHELRLEP